MSKKFNTREGWLIEAVKLLDKEFFAGRGYKLPEKLGVSCGFPKGGGGKAIGQCWDPEVCEDGTTHMFICPSQGEALRVLDILLHEMIHASVGLKEKHGGQFKVLAREFGLEGKLTATFVTEGTELHGILSRINKELGDYPHAPMKPRKKPSTPSKWVRFVSINEPKYKVVINIDRVEEFGPPVDPWGDAMEEVNKED